MEESGLKRDIIDSIRGMALDGQRVADNFAHRHGLNATDMRAITMIMDAERQNEALTAGQLSMLLGTSTGATTAVIDRLERIGHIRRNRGHSDRRKVTLHFEPLAMELAGAYFRPLGMLTDEVMSRYTTQELETVHRFMEDMRKVYAEHQATLDITSPGTKAQAPNANNQSPGTPAQA